MRQLTCDSCDGEGWCTVHAMRKHARWTYLCRTNPRYRRAYDAGRGPGQVRTASRPSRAPLTVERRGWGGAGTELKRLLRKFGIVEAGGCGCKNRAQIMDSEGPDWCERHLETIVSWLAEEAKRRRLPFIHTLGRLLVRRAIRNARKKLEILSR